MDDFINSKLLARTIILPYHRTFDLRRKSTWPALIRKRVSSRRTNSPRCEIGIGIWALNKFCNRFEWKCAVSKIDDCGNLMKGRPFRIYRTRKEKRRKGPEISADCRPTSLSEKMMWTSSSGDCRCWEYWSRVPGVPFSLWWIRVLRHITGVSTKHCRQ